LPVPSTTRPPRISKSKSCAYRAAERRVNARSRIVEFIQYPIPKRSAMSKSYQAELVGVLGQPVAENPTGVMQEAAFAARGLNWRYLNLEVAPERLRDAMTGVRAMGFKGINLTIPHKVAVIPHLDGLSEEARLIGAVNTV